MYKVIKFFTDLQDNNRPYEVDDIFPCEDCSYPVSEERIAELAGNHNRQGVPLIEKVEEEKPVNKMKVDELKAYAEEKGIDLTGAGNKEEILAKIKEAEATEN